MRLVLLATLWVHLASSVLLAGAFFALLLAGWSDRPTARRWDATVIAFSRLLVLVALASGIGWLLARTAVFEGRTAAALEPRAVWHALLGTRAGLLWLTRHALLVVLGVFLALPADVAEKRNWIAARSEAFGLGMLALALVSGSSHAAAVSPGTASALAADIAHLLGSAIWIGGLAPLAYLLLSASRDRGADSRPYAVLAVRRFSRVAFAVVIVLMGSGAMNTIAQVASVAGLAGTPHGRLLLVKLGLFLAILLLAAVNRRRFLPALSGPGATVARPAMRRLAAFVGLEAVLGLVVLALAATMTVTTPARHAPPVWPLPFRFSLEIALDTWATGWRALLGSQLLVLGVVSVVASRFARRRRAPMLSGALVLIAIGAIIGLPPIVVDAYPTTYQRPPVTYHAASIAAGLSLYRGNCARCHEPRGGGGGPSAEGGRPPSIDLRSPAASRRLAGDLYWLITRGIPRRGMPAFERRLTEPERWDVVNALRALSAAGNSGKIGHTVEPDRPWLVAPDFVITVGVLPPGALRDYRGRRMVLLVLYTLPASRPRMAQLASSYDLLWVTGVEVIAIPTDASSDAIRQLGASPPVLFPVVTESAADIVTTYRMLAPGPHAELLIDRQGYIRAIWTGPVPTMPEATALLSQVERLNEETSVVPFPDEHVH